MGIASGVVVEGKVVVDGVRLVDGTTVAVITPEDTGVSELNEEEVRALLEGIAQADRGDTLSLDEVFAKLDRNTMP
jgi:redox-sensitive bicupin YhaK (pirin superfamily)